MKFNMKNMLLICLTLLVFFYVIKNNIIGKVMGNVNNIINGLSVKNQNINKLINSNKKYITIQDALQLIKLKYGKGGEKKLLGKYTIYSYKPSTINEELKNELDIMLCDIIKSINLLTNEHYEIDNYENIVKHIDEEKKNILYKVTFFILEPILIINKKIHIEFHYNIKNSIIHINKLLLANSVPNIIANSDKNFYINTDITKKFNKNINIKQVHGIFDSNLENSNYNNEQIKSNFIKQDTIVPCKELGSCWDTFGILQEKCNKNLKPNQKCVGVNSSTNPKKAEFAGNNPTHLLYKENIKYNGLFSGDSITSSNGLII
tara:strand:- start:742 stop:1698 length:957 start_codon:yes stop_codon:yes gene_type:complete